MFISEWWLYFGIAIALIVVLNITIGVLRRLKMPMYKRLPEFSWDELDGGERSPSGRPGNEGK